MTSNPDTRSASRTALPDAPQADADGAPARLDPAALTVAQLARLLGVAEQKVREHVARGAPVGPDGRINLVHYTAWLLKKAGDRRPEAGGPPA
jgi:predicted transcriptional regulator